MKRFFKIFLPLAAIVLGIQLIAGLLFLSLEGHDIRWPLIPVILFIPPVAGCLYLYNALGVDDEKNGGVAFFPFLCGSVYFVFSIVNISKAYIITLFPVELALIALGEIIAILERKHALTIKAKESAAFIKKAQRSLDRFKASQAKQYIIVSNVNSKDIMDEMDDDCLLFQLSDGRFFVIMNKAHKVGSLLRLMNDIRNEAEEDFDVIAYVDENGGKISRMFTADITGKEHCYVKGKPSYIGFDYSLLDGAQPIVPPDSVQI